jgi:hypothetical protein
MPTEEPSKGRLDNDAGAATSLTIVLLTPIMLVLAFAAWQAALWNHEKTQARVIARDTAGLIARAGVGPDDARASATSILASDSSISDVIVDVSTAGGLAVVTVRGNAPGIIRGTASALSVTVALPIEATTAP